MPPNSQASDTLHAKCACGAVQATLRGPFRQPVGCHCEICRRQSGHYVAATAVEPDHLQLDADEDLTWWQATPRAERGFCRKCGSLMFWRPAHGGHISIFMGCVDQPTGLRLSHHICLDEAGDYYTVDPVD